MSWSRCLALSLVVAAAAVLPPRANADGLIYRLPPDGVWVRYSLSQEGEATLSFPPGVETPPGLKNPRPLPYKGTGSLVLRSVGTTDFQGETCRWIELRRDGETVGKMPDPASGELRERKDQRSMLLKMLIPEKYLTAGSDPLAHVLKLYFQDRDGEAELVEDEKAKQYQIDRFRPLFPAPPHKPAAVQQESLDTLDPKLGRINCKRLTFDSTYEGPLTYGRRGWWSWQGKHEIWTNERVPFGVAALKFTGKSDEWSGDKQHSPKCTTDGTQQIVVLATGEGAKSEMPTPPKGKTRNYDELVSPLEKRPPTMPGSPLTMLLCQKSVQEKLHLNETQIAKVKKVDEELGPLTTGGEVECIQRDEKAHEGLRNVLSGDQMKQLYQIALKQFGLVYGLKNRWIADRLSLTAEQRKKAVEILKNQREETRAAVRAMYGLDREKWEPELHRRLSAIREDAEKKALGVLDATQKTEYEQALGDKSP